MAPGAAHRAFIYLCGFGSVSMFVWWVHATYTDLASRAHLEEERRQAIGSFFIHLLAPFAAGAGRWLGPRIDRLDAQARATGTHSMLAALRRRAERMLTGAGRPHGFVPNEFMGLWLVARFLGAVLGVACQAMLSKYWAGIPTPLVIPFYLVIAMLPELLGLYLVPGIILLGLAVLGYAMALGQWSGATTALCLPLVLLGVFMPWVWLRDLERKRKRLIRNALPYALDLLTLSVEAGLDFTAALARIIRRQPNTPLSQELGETLRQIQMGVPRAEALRDLHERVVMEEIFSVTSALIQADELGASLGPILRIQADQFRIRRSQAAEKAAMEAPVKLLFPLICFFFPATFIMIFGPVFLQFVYR
jgi:pilus assembly protein TadC